MFSWNGFTVQLADERDRRIEWIAPVEVEGRASFRLLAVWAMHNRASEALPGPHQLETVRALDGYRDWYDGRSIVMAGDLNANVIWDRPRATARNHSNTIAACEQAGLVSAYHAWTGEAQGEELQPTIYWRDRTEAGLSYHIDYAFIPREWVPAITALEVGRFKDWVATKRSDHVPLVVDIDLEMAAEVTDRNRCVA